MWTDLSVLLGCPPASSVRHLISLFSEKLLSVIFEKMTREKGKKRNKLFCGQYLCEWSKVRKRNHNGEPPSPFFLCHYSNFFPLN